MDNAVHVTAGALDRVLERVHGPGDVLFERVRYENVVVLGIAIISTGAREIINSVMRVATAGATRRTLARAALRCARGRCSRRRGLLGEKFRCGANSGEPGCHF